MLQTNQTKKTRVPKWDWILIVGLTLAPMQEFRIGKVGPGEALLLLWSVRYLKRILTADLNNLFYRFWCLFLPVICLGSCFCIFLYPEQASASGLITYVFFAVISFAVVTGLSTHTVQEIKQIIYAIGIVAAFWYMFLYFYSKNVSPLFFGAHLWYRGIRFSGGADNPHQVATLIGAVLFFNVIHISDRRVSLLRKIIPAVSCVFSSFIALQTKSSTLIVSIIISIAVFLYYLSLKHLQSKSQKWIVTLILLVIVSVVIGVFREKLYDYVFEWVKSDANGLGRFEIFASIGDTLHKNWLFGLGPGVHGMGGTIEYHNAYLEILAMGGVLGLIIFLIFSVRLFSGIMKEPAMILGVVPLYAYGMGGFSMRRVSFWVIVAIISSYSQRLGQEQTGKSGKTVKAHAIGADQRFRS